MKKQARIISMLLTIALAFSLTTTALAANVKGFTDVQDTDWFAKGVEFCVDKGIMSGTSSTTFAPGKPMTRAMMVAVMYRAVGSPEQKKSEIDKMEYKDVPKDAYYAAAVCWASKAGVMSGYSKESFGPNDNVNREQIVTILWRYMGSPEAKADDFADKDQISAFATKAVTWARNTGVVAGKGGNTFDPKGEATRAQVAVIFQRFIQS